ncbi:MAG TPA: hypothetical protein VHA54_03460 [Solirubrobacterales bacterium]|nr:hypothetical protein [Solirubrobacterales bacterium]
MTKAKILEWESRWAKPVAIVTFLAVILLIVSQAISPVSGDGDAEILRSTHEHASGVTISSLVQALGFLLFAVPLYYLFRAAGARSERVRRQLVGLVLIAPLFLAISTGLSAAARNEAASSFVDGKAKPGITAKAAREDCESQRKDKGADEFGEEFSGGTAAAQLSDCTKTKVADEEASNALSEASTAAAVSGFGIAGALGMAISIFYTCLWAMRTGLLSRFWASLGMALGVALLLGLILFTLIWFVYLGLLLLGVVPGGRPPAWAAGEAIPWPTPGEKAAAELEGPGEEEPGDDGTPANEGERRKRKQRD